MQEWARRRSKTVEAQTDEPANSLNGSGRLEDDHPLLRLDERDVVDRDQ